MFGTVDPEVHGRQDYEYKGLVRNFTELQFSITKSDYSITEWKDDVRPGFAISLTYCALIIVVCFCFPNLFTARYKSKGAKLPRAPKVEWPYKTSLMYRVPLESNQDDN